MDQIKKCDNNGIWRIHEYKSSNNLHVLEYIDKNESHDCPLTDWFIEEYYDLPHDKKFNKDNEYNFREIKKYIKRNEYNEDLTYAIKNPNNKYEFQDDMYIDISDDYTLNNKEFENIINLVDSYKDIENRCKLKDPGSNRKSICFKIPDPSQLDDAEQKRFNKSIQFKHPDIKDIKIGDIRNYTIKLLKKLNKKTLFEIYQSKPDNTINDDNLQGEVNKIKETYKNLIYILPEEIQIYLEMYFDTLKDDKYDKGSGSGLKDIQGLQWHPEKYNSLLTELQTGTLFRQCVDKKLKLEDYNDYDKIIKDFMTPNFNIKDKHVDFIIYASEQFESLTPQQIQDCIDKLTYSDILKDKICNGEITLTMLESFGFVLEFIGIHVKITDLTQEMIERLMPYIQKVFHKIITTSEHYEQVICNGKSSKTTNMLKTFYNKLFEHHKPVEYPFKNMINLLPLDFFKDFFKNIFTKCILLIFICFIFSQMVKLFTNRGDALPIQK